jgi:hypothetical protein
MSGARNNSDGGGGNRTRDTDRRRRSRVIRVGTAAATELLQPGDILEVAVAPDGSIVLR